MLTFRGGREVQGYPVSNAQAISEINESLGLVIDQFMAGKKIAVLNAPGKYLQDRNDKLAALIADIYKDSSLGSIGTNPRACTGLCKLTMGEATPG